MSDVWSHEDLTIEDTLGRYGAGISGRPVGYDPSLSWDSGLETWLDSSALRFAGGGRYHPRFVVMGRDATGYGRIYFSE